MFEHDESLVSAAVLLIPDADGFLKVRSDGARGLVVITADGRKHVFDAAAVELALGQRQPLATVTDARAPSTLRSGLRRERSVKGA